jgi:hypothetical protein
VFGYQLLLAIAGGKLTNHQAGMQQLQGVMSSIRWLLTCCQLLLARSVSGRPMACTGMGSQVCVCCGVQRFVMFGLPLAATNMHVLLSGRAGIFMAMNIVGDLSVCLIQCEK